MNGDGLPLPYIISTSAQLAELITTIRGEPSIALDTESNSLYAYRERICLVQLSTRTADYLIDTLTVEDMSPLGELTANPAIEIIFHAAEYDIIGLKRDYGFVFTSLFDTMAAARILGVEKFGLANLLQACFSVSQDKRFQRADWSKRPLTMEQQRYAQIDTHYLLDLRKLLYRQLTELGALEEAWEIFDELAKTTPQAVEFDPEGHWSIHTAKHFNSRQRAMLHELYLWREKLAQKRNMPPFKVMTNEYLVAIVEANPHTTKEMEKKKVLKTRLIRQHGNSILKALAQGRKADPPKRPRPDRIQAEILTRYELLKRWRKQRAEQRGVESDIIVPPHTLWTIAKAAPRNLQELQALGRLGPWRVATYGTEILRVLQEGNQG
jgi:ribonuclease D